MKRVLNISALLGCILLMSFTNTHANEVPDAKEFTVLKPFKGVAVKGNINVVLISDSFHGVQIPGDNEDSESIIPRIAHGELYLVRTRETNSRPVTVFVSCKILEGIEAYGAAKITNQGVIMAKNLYLYVHESGEINLNLLAENISANVKKKGCIILGGDFDQSAINVFGTGKVRLNGGIPANVITSK